MHIALIYEIININQFEVPLLHQWCYIQNAVLLMKVTFTPDTSEKPLK